jgi:hypothetical protein
VRFTFDSLRKLAKAVDFRRKRHEKAVANAISITALYIQRESQKIVPVDTGALRNSAGTRTEGKGSATEAFVFYTMFYAVYVHENIFNYHKPPTRARFLESVLEEKKHEITTVFERAYQKSI